MFAQYRALIWRTIFVRFANISVFIPTRAQEVARMGNRTSHISTTSGCFDTLFPHMGAFDHSFTWIGMIFLGIKIEECLLL